MSITNAINGDSMMGDLSEQLLQSENRRTIAAAPADFIRWVSQTIRDQKTLYSSLKKDHSNLAKASELATIGLKRLSSLVRFKDTVAYEHLVDIHRDFTFKNKNIGYALSKCKQTLDSTTMNMQLVGETLSSTLADSNKKKAMQSELGLRLRDVDSDFATCKQVVSAQKKTHMQLAEGIQKLMSVAGIKLPPKLRQDMNREDAVAKLAVIHKASLQKGNNAINIKPLSDSRTTPTLGSTDSKENSEIVTESIDRPKLDPKIIVVSLTIGLIFGSLYFFRDHL